MRDATWYATQTLCDMTKGTSMKSERLDARGADRVTRSVRKLRGILDTLNRVHVLDGGYA